MAEKKAEDFYTRPPTLTKGQQFSKFLYNPSTHELLGRTAKSWFQIILFYIVLYAFLAGFFAGLLMVFFQTLNNDQPTWTLESSLIGSNPGMGFRPASPNPDETIISYKPDDAQEWVDAVDKFLEPYYECKDCVDCKYGGQPAEGQACRFDVALQNCTKQRSYGYKDNKPCLFLKLNKIFGWNPKPYTREQIESLENMPIKEQILNLTEQEISNNVWVTCQDDSGTGVSVTYDSNLGFPRYYFPFTNQKNYLSPLVVVQLDNVPADTAVKVSCRLWADNITNDRQRRLGMTNIELLSRSK